MTGTDPAAEDFPRLTARLVVRKAFTTYRAQFWRVAIPAVCVLVPFAVLETVIREVRDNRGASYGDLEDIGLNVLLVFSTIFSTLALVFYAGLLDRLVGAYLFGHEDPSIRHVLRTLPYRKLIVADLLLVVVTVVGLILLILPAIAFFTLFCLVGPVINIEGYGVIRGFRETARLVRPRFWLAFWVVTVPVIFEISIEDLLHAVAWERQFVSSLLLNTATAVLLLATVGLLEVVLAHELIARKRAQRAADAVADA